MDFFDLLKLIGGLSLFLFGMNIMGQALERRAGNRLVPDGPKPEHDVELDERLLAAPPMALERCRAVRGSDPDSLNHFTAYEKKYALS